MAYTSFETNGMKNVFPFPVEQGTNLEDVLILARKYLQDQKRAGEEVLSALFIFEDVHVEIWERSHLGYIWSNYMDAPKGDSTNVVGPCEISPSKRTPLPLCSAGWNWRKKRAAQQTLERLRIASSA